MDTSEFLMYQLMDTSQKVRETSPAIWFDSWAVSNHELTVAGVSTIPGHNFCFRYKTTGVDFVKKHAKNIRI